MAETERLRTSAEIYFINGTSLEIDIYVNGEPSPSFSDPSSLAVGPTFVVKGDQKTPFQVYSFVVRLKGEPDSEILASASANMELGRSFTGVFHWRPDATFQFSVYENDLSRGTEGRLTVRNTSSLEQLTWTLTPNGENPEVPVDERSGTLGHAQWQIARGVTTNDYLFRAFADGGLVTQDEDLDIGLEQNLIVHIVGAPYPTDDNSFWEQWMVVQELEYDPGIKAEDSISEPAPPVWESDQNQPVQLDCPPVTLQETVGGAIQIGAVDPDGWILNFEVMRVDPNADGFVIGDNGSIPSAALGAPATATVWVDPDLPEGQYDVTIEVNTATLAQRATCVLQVTVEGVSIDRLNALVGQYSGQPAIDPSYADELTDQLNAAAQAQSAGNTSKACRLLKQLLTNIDNAECGQITESAIVNLTREAKELRKDLNCG
ncbi:hypothetical protein CKO28_06855 [Rhodovibrio sodomensis]|uniref:FIMAH domain-containing protein n=1 Tax=Rhodovibrio sodomensis TaxID=1088 RepID=A0ABS1DCT0_9PROT|nr:hypothetical protein [Rhodovibrio sodomensis]MBK1667751.1 hypothetical protein [Rhodovibrio sodomensis]